MLTPSALAAAEEKSAPARLSLSEVVSVRDVTDEFRLACQSTAAQLVVRLVEVWRDLPAAQEVWHPLLALLPGVHSVAQCWGSGSGTGSGSSCFWNSRIRILLFSHKCVERTEMMPAK